MKVTLTVSVEDLVDGVVQVREGTRTVKTDGVSMREIQWGSIGFRLVNAALDEFEGQLVPTTEIEESEEGYK